MYKEKRKNNFFSQKYRLFLALLIYARLELHSKKKKKPKNLFFINYTLYVSKPFVLFYFFHLEQNTNLFIYLD